MRIIHVITRLILGGAQENTVASVLGLGAKKGLTVRLLSGPTAGPEGSLEGVFNNTGILSHVPALVRPIHPWKDYQALQHLTRLFRAERPHLVHTHSGKAGILGRLAAHRAKVPIIVHTIHGPSFGAFQSVIANAVFTRAERLAARWTTHFVSVAEAMTRQYLAAGIGQPEQFSLIRSGFDLEPILIANNDLEFRAELGFSSADLVIGKIARLTNLKGHDDLVNAAPSLVESCPRIRFLIVGDGPLRQCLENRVRQLDLEKYFVFAGLVPAKEIPRYLGIMDMLVHLSRREGLARSLSQALAAGRPVIAYDCDGAGEVCLPDETGYLVEPGDIRQLIVRVLHLASHPEERQRLGRRGQGLVKEMFSVERMVQELYALYESLARRHKCPFP